MLLWILSEALDFEEFPDDPFVICETLLRLVLKLMHDTLVYNILQRFTIRFEVGLILQQGQYSAL